MRPDALPRTVLEAMAAGTPTAGANIGGVPDMIRHAHTGLLHAPGDAAALARDLIRLLTDIPLRQSLGAAARERAQSGFSAQAHARKIADLYEFVLKKAKIQTT